MEEVTAGKRKGVEDGYPQVAEITEQPRPAKAGMNNVPTQSGIARHRSVTHPRASRKFRRAPTNFRAARGGPRRQRLVGLVRGRAAAIGRLPRRATAKVTHIITFERRRPPVADGHTWNDRRGPSANPRLRLQSSSSAAALSDIGTKRENEAEKSCVVSSVEGKDQALIAISRRRQRRRRRRSRERRWRSI